MTVIARNDIVEGALVCLNWWATSSLPKKIVKAMPKTVKIAAVYTAPHNGIGIGCWVEERSVKIDDLANDWRIATAEEAINVDADVLAARWQARELRERIESHRRVRARKVEELQIITNIIAKIDAEMPAMDAELAETNERVAASIAAAKGKGPTSSLRAMEQATQLRDMRAAAKEAAAAIANKGVRPGPLKPLALEALPPAWHIMIDELLPLIREALPVMVPHARGGVMHKGALT